MSILENELKKLPLRRLKRGTVILMGRMEHVRTMADFLSGRGVRATMIFDNSEAKIGRKLGDLPVVRPFRDERLEKDAYILIYSPTYWRAMSEQMTRLGYDKSQIRVVNRPTLRKNISLANQGERLYKGLKRKYGNDAVFFLNTAYSHGDQYLISLFLREYCEKNGIGQYVLLGRLYLDRAFNDFLGIRFYEPCSDRELEALAFYWKLFGAKTNLKPTTIWVGNFNFNRSRCCRLFGFIVIDLYRVHTFGLDVNTKPAQPVFCRDREKIRRIFEENGFYPSKTVLIAPYSYSVMSLPDDFWRELCAEIKALGYDVAVNVKEGEEKNMLHGTTAVSLQFTDAIAFMEYGGYAIGMRSGFFDITSQAKCKKIVIYPPTGNEERAWIVQNKEYSGLARNGLCADAVEIEAGDLESTKRMILSVL